MNLNLLWAVGLAVLLVGGGLLWLGLARRAGRRRAAPPARPVVVVAARPAARAGGVPAAVRLAPTIPAPPVPASGDSARLAAQHAQATDALRQARRRAAADAEIGRAHV